MQYGSGFSKQVSNGQGMLNNDQINRLGQRPEKKVHNRRNNFDEIGKELEADPNEDSGQFYSGKR